MGPRTHTPTPLVHARCIQLDAASTEFVRLGTLWNRFERASWIARSTFSTNDKHYLLAEEVVRTELPGPPAADFEILRRVLLGQRQKTVAIELHRSAATITNRLRACLRAMGFSHQSSRAPALLVPMAAAAAGAAPEGHARLARANGNQVVVSIPRFEEGLSKELSPAEIDTVRLLVDGETHAGIAAIRGCATRTVANQVSSIFRKLRVCGRFELLLYLTLHHAKHAGCRVGVADDLTQWVSEEASGFTS